MQICTPIQYYLLILLSFYISIHNPTSHTMIFPPQPLPARSSHSPLSTNTTIMLNFRHFLPNYYYDIAEHLLIAKQNVIKSQQLIGNHYQEAVNGKMKLSFNLQYINQRCPDNPSHQVVLEHLVRQRNFKELNNPLIIPSKNKNKNLVLNIILAETGCHHPLRNIIIHINLMIFF